MEAAPRLPMLSFELNNSTENPSFGTKLKQYITTFYHEDGETYNTEIHTLETLRAGAVRPTVDIGGCQLLKKYYCQLHFLKSRFPMEEGQPASVSFTWKNPYSTMVFSIPEIQFELMAILYNIGALHSKLGAEESRTSQEGMKMACTHFQCAAWAFQTTRETYPQMINLILAPEIVHYMQQVCLAQAQECILEKSMLDNRKATIIARIAVQVVNYYKHALHTLQAGGDDGSLSDIVGGRTYKDWVKYLSFKVTYHNCIALLYQGQQAEELQKMGERVSFYQAACEQLEEARKLASHITDHKQELAEALAFTADVVEGKRKAAKNENEFIYHEDVPDVDALQVVDGASLVKGIPFSVNDVEVSGKDIFARLVPMEAHEAASLYSEKKAEMLRQLGQLVDIHDQRLAEFMSSLQLDFLTQMRQATGLSQDLVDRAAALSAQPSATQDLVDSMAKLSNSYHEVEAMLNEINELLKEEEQNEKDYQTTIGKRPPSIIATDLAREAAKYKEAHTKASESNETLHRAMSTHIANLKILAQPLSKLQQQIPSVELPNKNVDEAALRDLEILLAKVDEMKAQRGMLWAQLRDAMHKDDITSVIVTKQPDQSVDHIFEQELQKHQHLAKLLEQNTLAQENICKALVDAYANFSTSRRYVQDIINKRNSTITALLTSYDTYDDLLGKANKGIEFYNKLETNVSKLLQRIRSACKVQEEEREQMLAKATVKNVEPAVNTKVSTTGAPKLRDYLDSMKKDPSQFITPTYPGSVEPSWPPGVRPAPLGSEMNVESALPVSNNEQGRYTGYTAGSVFNNSPILSANAQMSHLPGSDNNTSTSVYGYTYGIYPDQQYSSSYQQHLQPATQQHVPPSQQLSARQQPTVSQPPEQQSSTIQQYTYNQIPSAGQQHVYSQQPTVAPAQLPVPSQQVPTLHQQQQQLQQQQPQSASTVVQQTFSQQPTQSQQGPYSYTAPQTYQQVPTVVPQNAFSEQPQTFTPQPTPPPPTQLTFPQSSPAPSPLTSVQPGTGLSQQLATGHQQLPPTGYSFPPPPSSSSPLPVSQEDKSVDDVLSERMAALLNSKKRTLSAADNYQFNQYSQYGYNPQTKPTYSGTNYSYPVMTQAYTITSSYQQIPTTSQQTEYYSTNSYSAAPVSQSENYSVPSSGTAESFRNTPQTQMPYPAVYSGANGSYTNYIPQNHDVASSPSGGVNSLSYSANAYNGHQSYYEQYQSTDSGISNQPYVYGSTDQKNQYTNPEQSQYTSYYQTATNDTTPQIASGVSDQASSYNYYQTPVTTTTHTPQISTGNLKSVEKSSNVDLLSGLDFTVNQLPLTPQPTFTSNTLPERKEEKSEAKAKAETVSSVVSSEQSKEKKLLELKKPQIKLLELPKRNLLDNQETYKTFVQEAEKFEKFVDTLTSKTLNGPTTLEVKWKEIVDKQDADVQKRSISVARCYPMKNRSPDILPYDYSRVELITTKDDYINASHVRDITPYTPPFIVTQCPMVATLADFWTMVWEQQVEVVVCLLNDNNIGDDAYWPKERGKDLTIANMVVSLQNVITKQYWVERIVSVTLPELRESRVIMQLQFLAWPGSVFPTTATPLLAFAREVISLHQQQRVLVHPILVHCYAGVGLSGMLCLLIAAILDLTANPTSIPDLTALAVKLSVARKNILRDREHLKFAYLAFLSYLNELRGLDGNNKEQKEIKVNKETEEKQDPLSCLDPLWASKKGG